MSAPYTFASCDANDLPVASLPYTTRSAAKVSHKQLSVAVRRLIAGDVQQHVRYSQGALHTILDVAAGMAPQRT